MAAPPITMPWGKYRGQLLEDVPTSYLVWLLESERIDALFARRVGQHVMERIAKLTPGANPDGSYGDPHVFSQAGAGPKQRVYEEQKPTSNAKPLRAHAINIVNAGFRKLAQEHHPDKGGSHDIMATLSDAAVRLRKFAENL